jgi:class 3 adenylate cyclase
MSTIQEPSLHDRATAALAQHAWHEAYDLLADADARGDLAPDELELLAQAAWWIGRLPAAIDARERAYAAAVKIGDTTTAVTAAISLGQDNLFRSAHDVANAWLNRAEHLLEGTDESLGHGWLAAIRSFYAALTADSGAALAWAEKALEIGQRLGDRDLQALALSERGAALIVTGQVAEGLAAIGEATVAAVGGELEPTVAGGVCCTSIEACVALGEWGRAAEWTEAQDRWCKREGINGYPGMCRLFRSDIKRLRGAWLEAETEAQRASVELQGFIPAAVGQAFYQIGQIRLLRGDLPAAEDALRRGHALGHDPEPALSLLRLAEGKVEAAAASIRRALDEPELSPSWRAPSDSHLYRLTLLPAQVEIALAAGDQARARAAADELAEIAHRFATVATRATSAVASGAVLLAEGKAVEAGYELRRGIQLWSELDAPFEAARARTLLADALVADGATEPAAMELRAALDVFEQLGAAPERRRAAETLARLIGESGEAPPTAAEARARRAFMFTDIVDSTRLAELLGDEAWNGLLRWHDHALRAVVAEHGGEEIKRTGDGFFLAFDDPARAVACAVAIQRRLATQRSEQGFAPSVRIGVHWAEASRSGLDYIGQGVNQAARIGQAASGGEILVSAETLAELRQTFTEAGRRSATLKGIAAPVEVVSIGWR